jgi:hypothetical protein
MYVSCKVRTSSTYKNVKLSPSQAVEAYMYVSCEYEHHMHTEKSKFSSVTGR